ncbi:MAG: fatty acid desaturase [Gemmataceae bacterium]|nr:fatty acid desaturase [Gemmataceae bacterium]MCS7270859.1 fatty acid desaturase [Gemmataceae bacterium]MDW8243885.1 fatty acid desaturase [Thermogemmata sp.]
MNPVCSNKGEAAAVPGVSAPIGRQYLPWFVAVIVLMHATAVLALTPYLFVWWGIPLVWVGNFLFGSLGINLGYHRMLTHQAVRFPRPLEQLWVILGVCSLEGSPLWWACTHRLHHQHSDGEEDPHTPQRGFFWSHVGWIYTVDPRRYSLETYARYVPDLLEDRFLRWLHRGQRWLVVWLVHAVLLLVLGGVVAVLLKESRQEQIQLALQLGVWGLAVRTVYVWHITWLVNSAAHRWGYRNYVTADHSRNNWLVALLTNGEGWHNNHHAAPRACAQGHRWWEIDLTFSFVRLLERLGLAWDVVPVRVPAARRTTPPVH